MTREEILEKAKEQVTGQRITDYGKPEDSFGLIAKFWSNYLNIAITSKDVCVMMALLKIARIKGDRATDDSFIDLAGYAACGGECWNSDVDGGEMFYDGHGGWTRVKHVHNGEDELLTNTDPLKKKILEKAQMTYEDAIDKNAVKEDIVMHKQINDIDKEIIDWCKSTRTDETDKMLESLKRASEFVNIPGIDC